MDLDNDKKTFHEESEEELLEDMAYMKVLGFIFPNLNKAVGSSVRRGSRWHQLRLECWSEDTQTTNRAFWSYEGILIFF